MCIIAFQYKVHPTYDLLIVANRDEFYERPTKPAYIWPTKPAILAGQDEQLGGTWMGVNETGRFAAITNYRNPELNVLKPVSRGRIATDFLNNLNSAHDTIYQLRQLKDDVGPYNVLLYDGNDFLHYNNIFDQVTNIERGTHTLCNATLNTPWPKTIRLQKQFEAVLAKEAWGDEDLFAILQDETKAEDADLPSTGVPFDLEKGLSSIFVKLPHYGTRASTIIKLNDAVAELTEQTFINGKPTSKTSHHLTFQIKQNC